MKKAKQIHQKASPRLTPEQVVRFLEDFAKVAHGRDEKTQLISLRVPRNVLESFKTKAKLEGLKYQSVIVQLMRRWLN